MFWIQNTTDDEKEEIISENVLEISVMKNYKSSKMATTKFYRLKILFLWNITDAHAIHSENERIFFNPDIFYNEY